MVNSGEALLNVVTKAKRKMLNRLDQKGTWSGPGAPNSSGAVVAPPAERRDLTHTVTAAERGKPVVSPSGKAALQEALMRRRVEEEGASESRSVMERIGVALQGNITPRRKPADFPRVFRHERTLAN